MCLDLVALTPVKSINIMHAYVYVCVCILSIGMYVCMHNVYIRSYLQVTKGWSLVTRCHYFVEGYHSERCWTINMDMWINR